MLTILARPVPVNRPGQSTREAGEILQLGQGVLQQVEQALDVRQGAPAGNDPEIEIPIKVENLLADYPSQ